MKIIDTRDQTTFEGEHVDTIPANAEPTDAQLLRYYGVTPLSTNYEIFKRSQPMHRFVLQRGLADADNEPSFYIIPKYEFYKELK